MPGDRHPELRAIECQGLGLAVAGIAVAISTAVHARMQASHGNLTAGFGCDFAVTAQKES
jgi:hypothetical protein